MRRKALLIVEPLECRALLSGLTAALTTDQSVYTAGEPIQMTFTYTNTGDDPASFDYGPSFDGFNVSQGGQSVWESNSGVNPDLAIPGILQSGQSFSLHATWDGNLAGGTSVTTTTGTFVITNQLDPSGPSATFQIDPPSDPLPPSGSSPSNPPGSSLSDPPPAATSSPNPLAPPASSSSNPPQASDASPSIQKPPAFTATLTTNHSTTHAGKPVRITITFKNAEKTSQLLTLDAATNGITVLNGLTVIARISGTAKTKMLKPGKSLQLAALWNGKPNQPGVTQIPPGIYTIEFDDDGYEASGQIRIV
jgi:hypothetical protein